MPLPATLPTQVLYAQNTQVVVVQGLQDFLTGNFLNAAILTLTLLDQNGVQVPGCINVGFAYVAASNGNYQAVFGDESFNPPVGSGYKLVIDGNDGSGNIVHLERTAQVQARQT